MQLLETEVKAREQTSCSGVVQQPKKPSMISTPTAAALVASSTDMKPKCYFCGQPHYSSACSIVTSLDE